MSTSPPYRMTELAVETISSTWMYGSQFGSTPSHGIPTTEWLDDYLPLLRRVRDELSQIGVAFSINPWLQKGVRK